MSLPLSDPLENLDADALRALLREREQVLAEKEALITRKERLLNLKDTTIAQLTHEIAVLRRFRFGKKSEQINGVQGSLLEEAVAADIAAIEEELHQLTDHPKKAAPREQPKRQALPPELPRIEIHHEPESSTCACGCQLERIGEDVAEKLDYIPGVAQVERHIRGKWACRQWETLTQAPAPAHVIDKGLASTGLLAHVLVAKYADHLPLYRQQKIFERAGVKIPVSTMADWVGVCGVRLQPLVDALRETILTHDVLHADETPIQILRPDTGRKTHRAYIWAYAPGAFESLKAVIYDFAPSRAGEHARAFLGDWRGKLVVDDYGGYKKTVSQDGVTEIGCMAHARRKFFELHDAHQSQLAAQALDYIGELYAIEREAKALDATERWRLRQERAKPIADRLHAWMLAQRSRVPDGSGTAKALDYSLKRWVALTRYLDDGAVPIDNNYLENRIRPIAQGRRSWLFAGSLRAGRRAAAVMSLIQSANLNGLDPHAYLKDVLTRLPTHPNSRIEELLPHNWQPATA
ncbi:IS66 family transposase [Parapusillimonas granuli]|uniref:IS66 family transposase n=1 Tax=Parapusillimonas granuli TaxID=380911 RepID=A0A853FYQ1_9BURK|nr:IS66 family transposase [Parapusillimonas granuli]MBB5215700.1 transposase [Parapusillimonas granuli]NYT51234.1 IS66 family transposase [Parapusillimonas granuli]